MLLSVDWDAYSGCADLVFDAPIWGTPDREHDRLARWHERVSKRGGSDWQALDAEFPLYPGWQELTQYAGVPVYSALSHEQAALWLHAFPGRDVLNIDSHHDLSNLRGDPQRWRPGNWAGLGLAAGLIERYTVRYPEWHAGLLVTEGYDLSRTRQELETALLPDVLARVQLERSAALPAPAEVEAVLLVQSPSWTNPAHDAALFGLLHALKATALGEPPLIRGS
ncbi:arginase [Deinococcus sp. KNUC1210]|uniref:arginase n=1 Tax=Deinococcus sp. KNUC1210 TaxID=2917691 RepID=UPI001EF0D823|nr:arginase [Deinococcus sp. KNUC1210]ULH14840.1 arginase [Deinococcus sp. KNUC1210]